MVLANPTLICTTLYFMVGRSGEFVRTKELQIRGCFTTCEDITFSALHLSCLFQVSFDLWGRHIFLLRTWAAYYKFHLTCEDITLFSYSPELPITRFIWLVRTSHFSATHLSCLLQVSYDLWKHHTFSSTHLSCLLQVSFDLWGHQTFQLHTWAASIGSSDSGPAFWRWACFGGFGARGTWGWARGSEHRM
jgi:hypothetical protein